MKTKKMIMSILFFLSLGIFAELNAKPNLPEDFSKRNEVINVALSPSGQLIAIRRISDDESRLSVINVQTKKVVSHIEFKGKEQIGPYQWASEDRLVIEIHSRKSELDGFVFYGELYSYDISRKKGNMIFGTRMRAIRSNNTRERLIIEKHRAMARSWADVISTLPKNKDHILIAARPFSEKQNKIPRLYLLNISNGDIKFYTEAPAPHLKFITDQNGELAFATTFNKSDNKVAFEFHPDSKTWTKVKRFEYTNWFTPLLFDSLKRELIYLDSYDQDKRSLFSLSLADNKITTHFDAKGKNINWVHTNERTNQLLGVEIDNGFPEYNLVDTLGDSGKAFTELLNVFKGYKIVHTNSDVNGLIYLVYIKSDIEPGAWYLYDRQAKKAQFIAKTYETLDRTQLSRTQAFSFTSRDNESISGYLTLPKNNPQKKYAGVVLARTQLADKSTWAFQRMKQYLTSIGYAVIEINNRGSAKFGKRFSDIAELHWGDTVQYDNIDGVNYLIAQGIIDENKVCSMGEFIGGYSAVQMAILNKNKFKCIITKSAFYDLKQFKNDWLDLELPWGKSRFDRIFGDSPDRLVKFSPLYHLDQLDSPILVIHGERERKVPLEQAEDLVSKLQKLGKKYEWLEVDNEDSDIFKEESRLEYLQRIKTFLHRYNPPF